MPGNVGPVADEREGLLGFLAQQRYVLKLTGYGLTDEQARLQPTVSPLSIGGLIKHVIATEHSWMDYILEKYDREVDYEGMCTMGPSETLADVCARYDEAAARTASIIGAIPDLAQAVPVPKDAPWFPKDVKAWSVRWVLLHLATETARHAGHADIVRESIDGATAFPVMAAAEGWPASPWMTPWQPPAA